MRKIKDVLKIVFLTLAILTMLVSLFGRGHAAEMEGDIYDVVTQYTSSASNYNSVADGYIKTITDSMPYFNIAFNNTGDFAAIFSIFEGAAYFSGGVGSTTGTVTSYYLTRFFPAIPTSVFDNTQYVTIGGKNCFGAGIFVYNGQLNIKLLSYDLYSFTQSYNGRHYTYDQWINNLGYSTVNFRYTYQASPNQPYLIFGNSSINVQFNFDAVNMYTNGLPLMFDPQNISVIDLPNVFIPKYVEVNPDISVYKSLDNNGLPVLNVSWSKTPLPGTGGYNYAGYTNVDIKFDIDGSERVVSINSDDYPELFSNYADGKFYIPWSVFQKVALLVTDYDTVTSVSVTQVDVSMKGYPQGATVESAQTYTMNTLVSPALVFKGQDSSIPSFDNDDVQKGSEITPSEVYTPTEINYYIQKFSSSYGSGQWLYTTSDLQVPDNMDVFYLTLYGRESWFSGNYVDDRLLELNSFNIKYNESFDLDGMIDYVLNHASDFVNGYFSIYELAANNLFSSDYDIIAVQLYSFDNLLNKTKKGNLYFYTSRYYLSLINRQTVGLSEMMNITNSYLFGTYDFLYTRLNNMNGNMVSFFESSLNKQNSVLSYLGSVNSGLNNLNSNFVNLTSSTHGYLNNILTAIDNIDVPGPADLSGVLSKMDVIGDNIADLPNAVRSDLIYLFLPSYDDIDVSYSQYKENIGILALPFDTCKLVLDTVDDNYSQNLSIDLPKIEFLQYKLYDGMHYELDPWVFFDDTKLSENDNPTGQGFVMGLRYFIAFSAIYGAVLSTYLHIFRRVESN